MHEGSVGAKKQPLFCTYNDVIILTWYARRAVVPPPPTQARSAGNQNMQECIPAAFDPKASANNSSTYEAMYKCTCAYNRVCFERASSVLRVAAAQHAYNYALAAQLAYELLQMRPPWREMGQTLHGITTSMQVWARQ